ncbi:ankyrin repeat protein [Ciceribacter lividus]|uniref:Ankyrin repeat protein n=2 Tax=Ciceribacter lividus TaxID=1197950 RepID=A0A6I7HK95_9HYPH|nr:ankyrin repeat protein [Ciceribacter lividus]
MVAAFGYFTKSWQYPQSLAEAVCAGNVVGAFRRLHAGDLPDSTDSAWPYDGRAMFLAIDNTGCPKPMAFGLVDLLHFYGADVNQTTTSGYTLLMLAAGEGNEFLARRLIRWGARVDEQDSTGQTALMYAANSGHGDIARLLIESGADAAIESK